MALLPVSLILLTSVVRIVGQVWINTVHSEKSALFSVRVNKKFCYAYPQKILSISNCCLPKPSLCIFKNEYPPEFVSVNWFWSSQSNIVKEWQVGLGFFPPLHWDLRALSNS